MTYDTIAVSGNPIIVFLRYLLAGSTDATTRSCSDNSGNTFTEIYHTSSYSSSTGATIGLSIFGLLSYVPPVVVGKSPYRMPVFFMGSKSG
jgi:hypothetical protein